MDTIYLACDHAAFAAKEAVKNFLLKSYEVIDLGTDSEERCDYPEFAASLAKEIGASDKRRGILLCGSGIGVSIVANRFQGVRAALCRSAEDAKLSRQHNNANVLCLGARVNSSSEIEKIISRWLATNFEEGRHAQRLSIFENLGESIK